MPHYARQRIVGGINFAMVKRKARYCGSILTAVRIWSFAVRGLNWKGHQFQDQPREARNSPSSSLPAAGRFHDLAVEMPTRMCQDRHHDHKPDKQQQKAVARIAATINPHSAAQVWR
jgi:hypothetical protein